VVDIVKLRLFLMKDAVSKLLRDRTPISTVGFHHSGYHHSGLSPPSLQVTRLGDLRASASSVVAVSSGIQVRVFVECISTTKIND
jgi:hypothetical protein